jgi:hypothetical protein
MNCKPNTLAYLVESHTQSNIGAVVHVKHIDAGMSEFYGEPVWWCESKTGLVGSDGVISLAAGAKDRCLRPISGVPVHDEQHDEVKEPA